eukprot:COSAG02_NODE_39_length_48074_cov_106.508890_23_plen_593_part_00
MANSIDESTFNQIVSKRGAQSKILRLLDELAAQQQRRAPVPDHRAATTASHALHAVWRARGGSEFLTRVRLIDRISHQLSECSCVTRAFFVPLATQFQPFQSGHCIPGRDVHIINRTSRPRVLRMRALARECDAWRVYLLRGPPGNSAMSVALLVYCWAAGSLLGCVASRTSPALSAGALLRRDQCRGRQKPGMCFHSDVRLNAPEGAPQAYPSASGCCEACASVGPNGTAWPGTGPCRAWVWIQASSTKPSLVGQCHLFGTSAVNRSASTAELGCTSGFVDQPAPPQIRPNASWTVEMGEPELVLDTRGIVANLSSGLRRLAHQPQKMGIVLTPKYPWEAWIGFYTSVVQVSSMRYQLYYGCTGPANASVTFLCVAISSDGISFSKPLNLSLYTYGNNTNNNIVWATPYELLPGGGGTNGGHAGTGWANSVIHDTRPGVPASQRFKMTYDTDTSPFTPRQLLVASSPDGVHWERLLMASTSDGAMVPTAEFADTNTCLLWVPRLGRYVAFGRIDAGSPGAVCNSGSNFRRVGVLLEGGPQATNDSIPFSDRDFSGRYVFSSTQMCIPIAIGSATVSLELRYDTDAILPMSQ